MSVGHSAWGTDRGSADSHHCIGRRAGRPRPRLEVTLESPLDNVLGFEHGHRQAMGAVRNLPPPVRRCTLNLLQAGQLQRFDQTAVLQDVEEHLNLPARSVLRISAHRGRRFRLIVDGISA